MKLLVSSLALCITAVTAASIPRDAAPTSDNDGSINYGGWPIPIRDPKPCVTPGRCREAREESRKCTKGSQCKYPYGLCSDKGECVMPPGFPPGNSGLTARDE